MDSLRRRTADEDKGQRRNENRYDAALLVDSHTPADAGGGKRSQRAMDRANEENGCSEPVDVVKAGGIFIHDDSLKKQR